MRIDTSKLSIAEIIEQKALLIDTKKRLPIHSEGFKAETSGDLKPKFTTKAIESESIDPNKMKVKFIGNTALWCDSHMDVLAVGCFDKTISEQGLKVSHLVDHIHSLEAKVGKTLKLYTEMMNVQDFGIESDVAVTQSLMMESELIRSWNPKVFDLYKEDGVDQHSIGMQYVKLELAVNDAGSPEEFAIWNKVFPSIINKEFVIKRGYFWYVTEIKLFEISAVLFGSNELTPTISAEKSLEDIQKPIETTSDKNEKPLDSTFHNEQMKKTILLNH